MKESLFLHLGLGEEAVIKVFFMLKKREIM